ncbi:MAG: helix-turn-helix transcriptional regulator [Beijerinckiaceae bacterium]
MSEAAISAPASRPANAPSFRTLAAGDHWSVEEFICRAGPQDRPFEERHTAFSISAVLDGLFTYHGERGRALLHPGAILLGNHHACFQCGHDHSSGDRCISLQISPACFEDIAASMAGAAQFRFTASSITASRALLPHMAWLAAMAAETAALPDKSATEERVIAMTADILRLVSGHRPSPPQASARDEQRIAAVLDHLCAHASDTLDLATLARMAGVSKFHFLRLFRRVTGKTPYNYGLDLRLQQAAAQLKATRAPVSAIAFDCGFADLSTFNAMFRRTFGQTPREFRARA